MFSEGTQESLFRRGDKVLEYYNFQNLPSQEVSGREKEKEKKLFPNHQLGIAIWRLPPVKLP